MGNPSRLIDALVPERLTSPYDATHDAPVMGTIDGMDFAVRVYRHQEGVREDVIVREDMSGAIETALGLLEAAIRRVTPDHDGPVKQIGVHVRIDGEECGPLACFYLAGLIAAARHREVAPAITLGECPVCRDGVEHELVTGADGQVECSTECEECVSLARDLPDKPYGCRRESLLSFEAEGR